MHFYLKKIVTWNDGTLVRTFKKNKLRSYHWKTLKQKDMVFVGIFE